MQKLFVCGNIGQDAKLQSYNGNDFVSFDVAESRKFTDASGQTHEETTWVSCTLNGRNDKLLPYLVKGQKVAVMGRPSTRVYSSPKLRQMVAGQNLFVESIELLGGSPVRKSEQLHTEDGLLVTAEYKLIVPLEFKGKTLYGMRNEVYSVDGWGRASIQPTQGEPATENHNSEIF